MSLVSLAFVVLVAAIHLYILWLEMFAWESHGPSVFSTVPKEMFESTRTIAANQGLYNGFLAFGLLWTIFISNPVWQSHVAMFFFICVAVAGVFGAITVSRRILYVQALPGLLGIVSLMI